MTHPGRSLRFDSFLRSPSLKSHQMHSTMQKSFIKSLITAVVTACAVALSPTLFGQGSVSSGLTGTVLNEAGAPVAGASVVITHVPTNSKSTAVTSANGRFSVSGLRVGGPYTISATAP